MKKQMIVLMVMATALLTVGCSTFTTTQTDRRENAETGEITVVETKVKSRNFFDSKSALNNYKANQTEKSQGATVGSFAAETSGSNAVQVLKIVVEGAKTIAP